MNLITKTVIQKPELSFMCFYIAMFSLLFCSIISLILPDPVIVYLAGFVSALFSVMDLFIYLNYKVGFV